MNKKQVLRKDGYLTKRVFCYFGDYYLSSILLNVLVAIFSSIFLKEFKLLSMREIYEKNAWYIMILGCLISGILYFIVFPLFSKDKQTLVMKLLKFKISKIDKKEVTIVDLFMRYFIGCFCLQFVLFSQSGLIWDMVAIVIKLNVQVIYLVIGIQIIVIIISCAMCIINKNTSQTLHDKISKTYLEDIQDYSKPLRAL